MIFFFFNNVFICMCGFVVSGGNFDFIVLI